MLEDLADTHEGAEKDLNVVEENLNIVPENQTIINNDEEVMKVGAAAVKTRKHKKEKPVFVKRTTTRKPKPKEALPAADGDSIDAEFKRQESVKLVKTFLRAAFFAVISSFYHTIPPFDFSLTKEIKAW